MAPWRRGARAVVAIDACFSDREEGGGALVEGLRPLIPLQAAAVDKALVLSAGSGGPPTELVRARGVTGVGRRGFKKPQAVTVNVGSGPVSTFPLVAADPKVTVIEFQLVHR